MMGRLAFEVRSLFAGWVWIAFWAGGILDSVSGTVEESAGRAL